VGATRHPPPPAISDSGSSPSPLAVRLLARAPAPGEPPCPAYLRQPRAALRHLTRACNPSRPSPQSRRRLLTLAAPPPAVVVNPSCSPPEALQGSKGFTALFVRVRLHRIAGSASPDLRRRAFSPPAASSCPRRPGSPSLCSSAARRRHGAVPASVGAPQRLSRHAPPLTVAPPPAMRRPSRSLLSRAAGS
jgi:hypothetical protein